jgi:methyl-accepting chemotaxis protein
MSREANMTKRWGLAAISTFWTSAAVAAAMAFDGINEHVRTGTPIGTLVAEHLTHVVVLASAIYFVLWISFDLALAAPLRAIAAELYRLGTGSLEPIAVKTRVREIDGVARAVNLMVERMKLNFPRHAVDVVQADVTALRAIAHSLLPLAEDHARRIMSVAADLQFELATLLHEAAIIAQEARAEQRKPATVRR